MTGFSKAVAGLALVMGIGFCLFPLTNELHFFSGIILAVLASFIFGGIAATKLAYKRTARSGLRFLMMSMLYVLIAGIPVLLYTLIKGCFSGDGLSLWLLITLPAVIFSVSIGRFCALTFKKPLLTTISLLLFVAIGVFLIELYLYPQVYFFNHVWGYWPGPVYEDFFEFNPTLFYYRFITIGWALIFWLAPIIQKEKWVRLPLGLATISIMIAYTNIVNLGIVRPEHEIARKLGGIHQTEHAVLIYDARIPENEIRLMGMLHDFHIEELAYTLDLDLNELPRIRSYIYYHRWQKREITGAGRTNYVPVWNRNPQMHMHRQVVNDIVRHELVHVLSRSFGLPIINASISGAMIEGLAVALEGTQNPRITTHQTIAAREEYPDARFIRSLFNPISFYTGSGPRNYAVAGSFIGWMLDTFGAEAVKEAYAWARVESATGKTLDELVSEWHRFLDTVDTDTGQDLLAAAIFASPGLIDRHCAFSASPLQRDADTFNRLLAESDTLSYMQLLDEMIERHERLPAAFYGIKARQKLESGAYQNLMETDWWEFLTPIFRFDTHLMANQPEEAFLVFKEFFPESKLGEFVLENPDYSVLYLQIKFGDLMSCAHIPDEFLFLWLEHATLQKEEGLCAPKSGILPQTAREFTLIKRYIYQLIKMGETDLAENWLSVLLQASVNQATLEQANETRRFLNYSQIISQ